MHTYDAHKTKHTYTNLKMLAIYYKLLPDSQQLPMKMYSKFVPPNRVLFGQMACDRPLLCALLIILHKL